MEMVTKVIIITDEAIFPTRQVLRSATEYWCEKYAPPVMWNHLLNRDRAFIYHTAGAQLPVVSLSGTETPANCFMNDCRRP